jgi:uncharacterized protein
MTVDDLTTPLGQRPARRRREFPISVPKVIAAALALFLGAFVVWAIVGEDPFGGEPGAAVPIEQPGLAAANKPETASPPVVLTAPQDTASLPGKARGAAAEPGPVNRPAPAPGTKTVTIIDGKTGARQEIVIPAGDSEPPLASALSKAAR